jgi:hypothetical protein
MQSCTPQQYRQYLETFTRPAPADRHLMNGGTVGLVLMPASQFRYDKNVGYSFGAAAVVEEGTDNRLLFIRIDSWDPRYRETARPGEIDFCIPLAYEGASDRERLVWTIPLGGRWSDTREEAFLVLDSAWREWLQPISGGLAFSNPGAESGAFMPFGRPEAAAIQAFCAEHRQA